MYHRYTTVFLGYCRPGKTVCYAESMAPASGHHAGENLPRWCGVEQYNYWRLLSGLSVYGSLND
jgi:hypothetical protein